MTGAVAEWKGWRAVSILVALLIACYLVYFAITRPALDWDVVPYTMAILKAGATSPDGTIDAALLHARTWAAIKPHLSPEGLAYLTTSNSYVEAQFVNPAALTSQLPLYESKYGYIVLLKAVALAVDPVRGIVVVSLVSALGIMALLFHAAWRLDGLGTLAWLPIVLLFQLGSFASMVSPDTVFACAYVAGIAALLRPDGIVLNVFLCGAMAVHRQYRETLMLLVGSVAVYAMNMLASQHVGWRPQFYFNFVERWNLLTEFRPPFDPGLYVTVVAEQIGAVSHLPWVHAAVAAVMTATLLLAGLASGRWAGPLLGALLVGAAIRFHLYPSSELRFYTPHLFGIGLIILHAMRLRATTG